MLAPNGPAAGSVCFLFCWSLAVKGQGDWALPRCESWLGALSAPSPPCSRIHLSSICQYFAVFSTQWWNYATLLPYHSANSFPTKLIYLPPPSPSLPPSPIKFQNRRFYILMKSCSTSFTIKFNPVRNSVGSKWIVLASKYEIIDQTFQFWQKFIIVIPVRLVSNC